MIVAGFGFRSTATVASLMDAYALSGGQADALASVADKASGALFQEFAQALGLPVHAVPQPLLEAQKTQTHSPNALQARGTGSVAEAAALAVAGAQAQLLGERVISSDKSATCARAQGETR
jgi:cobalt-precorrin 5A hydrolase